MENTTGKEVKKEDLLEFLLKINNILRTENRIYNILAFGGSALTLYGFKEFTKDADLLVENVEDSDVGLVRKIKKLAIESGIKLDFAPGHQIVWWNLLDDYWEQAEEEKTWLSNINLKKMNIYDVIITKSARFSDQDVKDIISILENKKIDREFLKKRFNEMLKNYRGYTSQREYISENFTQVLKLIEEYEKKE